ATAGLTRLERVGFVIERGVVYKQDQRVLPGTSTRGGRSPIRRSTSAARSGCATHEAGSSWARSSATVLPCCSTQVKYFWLCQRRRTAAVPSRSHSLVGSRNRVRRRRASPGVMGPRSRSRRRRTDG